MLPVYDPKSFDGIDLRKYHVSSIKDAIKFLDFTMSRMEEAMFVLKKFNTQYATHLSIAQQLQKKLQEQQNTYGAGEHVNHADDKPGEIQSVEQITPSENKEREELLAEVKQAVANETLIPAEDEDPNARIQAEFEKYKAVQGKRNRVFYYRTNENGKTQMVSDKDVPEDIKEMLAQKMAEDAAKKEA